MRIRIYGKALERWTAEDERGRERTTQIEYAYMEYDSKTGEIIGAGSEDFSPKRLNDETEARWCWTWDGKKRNKGGHRCFFFFFFIRFRKSEKAEVKKYLNHKYNVEILQLR